MKLSYQLFEFKGPVIISNVYNTLYKNIYFDPQKRIIPKPVQEGSYLSNNQSALGKFLEIKMIITSQIQNIK